MTRALPWAWTRERALAAVALGLGVLALAGNPYRGHTVTIDTRELAGIISDTSDHVTVSELADRVVRGASDYRLVDLRTPAEYSAYHIPTAESVPLEQLIDYGLGRNEKIVLYSEGGVHAAQAWMLLKAERYVGVTQLLGGLDAWKDEVLYPVAPDSTDRAALARFEALAQRARYFGGAPRTATGAAALGLPTPSPAAPATGPGTPALNVPTPVGGKAAAPPPKKKKKEGC